jgi:hypothetical protein
MSTKDQTLSAELHGEALLAVRRPELQPLIDHLRDPDVARRDRAAHEPEAQPHAFRRANGEQHHDQLNPARDPELRLVIAPTPHLYYDNGLEAVDPLSRIPPRSCVASNESR